MVGNSDIQGMEHCILVYALPLGKVVSIGQKQKNAGHNCLQDIFMDSVKEEPHIFSHCQNLAFAFPARYAQEMGRG